MRAVSLFSNCGAGDIGFRKAGFRFDVMAEIDPRRLSVAKLNHPEAITISGDIRNTWSLVVKRFREIAGGERLALLSACPPCQGMSSVRHDRGFEEDIHASGRDERNLLVVPIIKVARALNPRIIVVENVPAFLRRLVAHPSSGVGISAARLLIDSLADLYEAFPVICDLADYGVPQTRKRAFITLVHRDEPIYTRLIREYVAPYPRPSYGGGRPNVTIGVALRKAAFPKLDARREISAVDPKLPLHFVPVLDEVRYAMVAAIPPFGGKSAWENSRCPKCRKLQQNEDAATCGACGARLLRPIVANGGRLRLISGFRASSYRRMRADRPASTITTGSGHLGSSFTIHPWENRVLSPLECATLQTFPRSFSWGDTLERFGSTAVREMIGEAVPPLFTRKHGSILIEVLRGQSTTSFISRKDERCLRAGIAIGLADGVSS